MKITRVFAHPLSWIALSGVLALYILYLGLQLFDARGVSDHLQAQNMMLQKAADGADSCLNKSDLFALAEAQDWAISPYVDKWSKRPSSSGSAFRVNVKPPLPSAKEPGVILLFDADDCLTSGIR